MKKIAIFVEGQTEADFMIRYLSEITSQRGLITVFEGTGGRSSPRVFIRKYQNGSTGLDFMINIYVSQTDNRVTSDIRSQISSLASSGFGLIIGLRDLRGQKNDGTSFSLTDLPIIESSLRVIFAGSTPPVKVVIAVMEIETWFLAETNHFQSISSALSPSVIASNASTIGVDPYNDDLTLVTQPAETLDRIYQLVGKRYDKSASRRQRTIAALDYANLYVNVSSRLAKFNEFAQIVDSIF